MTSRGPKNRMSCNTNAPNPACSMKTPKAPPAGRYMARFHVCECCAGPDEVEVMADGRVFCEGKYFVLWGEFNGHIVSAVEHSQDAGTPIMNEARARRVMQRPILVDGAVEWRDSDRPF